MRKIIVTDVETTPGAFRVSAVLWLDMPGKRGFRGKQRSSLPDQGESTPWGITDEEAAYFTKGLVTEQAVQVGPFQTGTDSADVRAALLVAYAAAQAQLDATASNAPELVGANWDGSNWSGK